MERLTFEGNFCDIAQCRDSACRQDGTCTCAACHNVGRVVKLKLPKALYRDGILQAEYSEYWLCLNCRGSLVQALMWPDAEE